MGFDQESEVVSVVSNTLPEFAALDRADAALGRQMVEVLGRIPCHDLRNACALSFLQNRREGITPADLGKGLVSLSAFQSGRLVLVEIEPEESEVPSTFLLKDLLVFFCKFFLLGLSTFFVERPVDFPIFIRSFHLSVERPIDILLFIILFFFYYFSAACFFVSRFCHALLVRFGNLTVR